MTTTALRINPNSEPWLTRYHLTQLPASLISSITPSHTSAGIFLSLRTLLLLGLYPCGFSALIVLPSVTWPAPIQVTIQTVTSLSDFSQISPSIALFHFNDFFHSFLLNYFIWWPWWWTAEEEAILILLVQVDLSRYTQTCSNRTREMPWKHHFLRVLNLPSIPLPGSSSFSEARKSRKKKDWEFQPISLRWE